MIAAKVPAKRLFSSLLLVLALAALPSAAWAVRDQIESHLIEIDGSVQSLTERVEELEAQVAPGKGFLSDAQAIQRYQDCVYLHLIGEYAPAAEGFFTLVTTGSLEDTGLHRDAEWYLAESLFAMGNKSTAEARYMVVAEDDTHPFRDEAVRRLLELYAETGRTEAFAAYYSQEIVSGRVRPSDVITYSVGKSFFLTGAYVESLTQFGRIGPLSPWYAKAQYFLGVVHVAKGELDRALPYFTEVTELSVETAEDRQVHDLALLALGRIHYERGELDLASDFYSQIAGDSDYQADKLYEIVWTFISQEEYQAALDGVEIFLLRFPEHEYTARLKLLEGHLEMEEDAYQSALSAYEGVVVDYTPIREQFSTLASNEDEQRRTFRAILDGSIERSAEDQGLPAYAVAMMLADEGLSRALTMYGELEDQKQQIAESEALISELTAVLESSAGVGGFERLRYSISEDRASAAQAQVKLLRGEEEWLLDTAGGDVKSLVEPLHTELEALSELVVGVDGDAVTARAKQAREDHLAELTSLEEEVAGLTTQADELMVQLANEQTPLGKEERERAREELARVEAELDDVLTAIADARAIGPSTSWVDEQEVLDAEIAGRVARLREDYAGLRAYSPDERREVITARIDGLHHDLVAALSRLAVLQTRLATMESSEVGRIRVAFEREVADVAEQKVELGVTLVEAEEVSVDLTRAGFGRLEDFFAESVLRADMGIVDVYWSQKLEVADQKLRMAEERSELMGELESRFELIRQKMGN